MSRSEDHNRMFAHETKHDAADIFLLRNVGEWISLRWRGDLFPPPQGKAYGTHLATFLLCAFGSEIRGLNFCWLFRSEENRPFRVGPPLEGINATWFFKYSTLKQFEAERLLPQDVGFLDLPDFSAECHAGVPPVVVEIRKDQRLDPFRCPGYPDDVSVTCGPSFALPKQGVEFSAEQVWVRLRDREESSVCRGELLNQPRFYDLQKGQHVRVRLLDAGNGEVLVCAQCPYAGKDGSPMPNEEEFIAVMRFKHTTMARAQSIWPGVAATANAAWPHQPALPADTNTAFAFFLASLFVEARKLYDFYKNEQATRLWAYVTNSFAVEPQYGPSALESLDFYSAIWDQYSREHLDPVQGVAYALLHRLTVPTKNVPPRVIEVIASAFASCPPWWEQFACQTQFVPSDVPTELSAFRLFAGEHMSSPDDHLKGRPDGTYHYYDSAGKRHEGWMPPERIEELLKHSGAKRLTRVLIKGPWEGIREDFLDVDEDTIAKCADTDGMVYAMCYFEKGEPRLFYLGKPLWDNSEHLEQISANPDLSIEQKKAEIERLKRSSP